MNKNQKPKVSEFLFALACYIIVIALALWSIIDIPYSIITDQAYNWWPLISLIVLMFILVIMYLLNIRSMVHQKTFSEKEE